MPALSKGLCHEHKVAVRGVRAASDAYLVDLHPLYLGYLADVIRHVGPCDHRIELVKVHLYRLVIGCILIWQKLHPIIFSLLGYKELARDLVAWKYRGGRAKLCAHVGYSSTLRHIKALYTLSAVLYYLADASLHRHLP